MKNFFLFLFFVLMTQSLLANIPTLDEPCTDKVSSENLENCNEDESAENIPVTFEDGSALRVGRVSVKVKFCVDLNCFPIPPVNPSVIGTFTDPPFDISKNLLTDDDEDGIWCTTVFIGIDDEYEYVFYDGKQDIELFSEEEIEQGTCTLTKSESPQFTNRVLKVETTPINLPVVGWGSCGANCIAPDPAPELPIIFDDQAAIDYNIKDFGGTTSFIGEDPLDPDNQVLCIAKPPGAECFAGTSIGGSPTCLENPVDFSADNTILTMEVFSPSAGVPILLKVENCDDPNTFVEVLTFTTVAGAWETLPFDFANNNTCGTPDLDLTYDLLSVFPNYNCEFFECGGPNPGFSSLDTENFYYFDNIMFCDIQPEITSFPPSRTIDCPVNAFPQLALFTAEVPFGEVEVSVDGPVQVFAEESDDCLKAIEYTYTAAPTTCGQVATYTQVFTLANEGPKFVCPVQFCRIECPADLEARQEQFDDYANRATVTTSCIGATIEITNDFDPDAFITQDCLDPDVAVDNATSYQIVTFTATDNCSGTDECTVLVVIVDTDSPTIVGSVSSRSADCSDNEADLQEGFTSWANFQLSRLSTSDGCSSGGVSLSYAPLMADVDCAGGATVTEVTFTATDACGNRNSTVANYAIIDNGSEEPVTATVAGTLMTEKSEYIELAAVKVDGFTNNTMMTSSDGYYHFDLLMAHNYAITPSREDHPLNGISTYDVVLLGQHLLELNLLDSPYKLIAADVNGSGDVSLLDLIELRRIILRIDDEFSTGKSWTFVEADYVFPQPDNPFATTYPTNYNINSLTTGEIADFIGIKLGDLNGSASPVLLQTGDTRSSDGQLSIRLEDRKLKAGQTYQLAFNARDFKDIAGFQFTLDFATDYLEVLDYKSSELSQMSADNFGFTKANDGKVTVSWNETTPVNMADDATLFQLSVTALKDIQLSEALTINSSITANEVYQANLRKEVKLDFGQKISERKEFALLQNQPNPFAQETLIGFQLPEATEASLTIYDVSGRVIYSQTKAYDAGAHQVMMNKSDLGATGILYYQLSTPEFTDTKRMIVL